MRKITTCLWYDDKAEEAANLYAAVFKNSRVGRTSRYTEASAEVSGRPAGSVMTVSFELEGQKFIALNGGPIFTFTPAVSFLVACETEKEVDRLWETLSEGGSALMELGEYPFSARYGWTRDRFGVSWQVMFMGTREIQQKITPTLMFTGEMAGRAEEAIDFYTSMFHNTRTGSITRYGKGDLPDREGTIKHISFRLEGQWFAAMDSARKHDFTFNEATSFMVHCETQKEIDYYWGKLSDGADPKAQQCGWLKDRFGVSWQIVPTVLEKMLQDPDLEKVKRVTTAFLKMKKFDIEELKKAYEGQFIKR